MVRLSLAIAEELRREKSRVTISILCPGPVDTGFNDRAGVQFRVKALTPEAVAKEAVFGLLTGKLLIIPGMMMRVGVAASSWCRKSCSPVSCITSRQPNKQEKIRIRFLEKHSGLLKAQSAVLFLLHKNVDKKAMQCYNIFVRIHNANLERRNEIR